MLKRCVVLVLIALSVVPAWSAAKKITVAELKEMLATMHRDKKADAEVANALKQVQLTEQLTRPVMNSMVDNVPGQLSTEQIYVLEARSAFLPPPATDIPSTPAPDPAAQQALLAKTADYVSKVYDQLPALTVTKTTLRFQDNVEAVGPSSGMQGGAKDVSVGSSFVNAFQFVHYINATDTTISTNHGAEQLPPDKTPWGSNRMIAVMEPDPNLALIFSEAKEVGSPHFLRWEQVNGKATAVYAFQVPKKKTHLAVNVCCFPNLDQAGRVSFTSAALGSTQGTGGGASGNLQTNTNWHPYKANGFPYRGEFFIDPDTGIVVRMIVQPELKQSDVVHQQDVRVDYGPVSVGDKQLVLPIKTVVNTEVVPNGESGAAGFSTRCTLFTSEYKNYHAGN